MTEDLKRLISKKEVLEKIITLRTKKEVIDFLSEKGYKVKDESEIESLREYLSGMYEEIKKTISEYKLENSELSDNYLENISGGKKSNIGGGAGVGMAAGAAIGTAISTSALFAVNAIRKKKGKKSLSELSEEAQWITSIGSIVGGVVVGGVIGGAAGAGVGYLIDKK